MALVMRENISDSDRHQDLQCLKILSMRHSREKLGTEPMIATTYYERAERNDVEKSNDDGHDLISLAYRVHAQDREP